MAVFYPINKHLMRLVPLGGYIGLAYFAGKIYGVLFPEKDSERAEAFTWAASAWIIGLRPVAIQSNLLMVDNLASCFLLGALYFVLVRRHSTAAIFSAMAVATRYTTWVGAFALGISILVREGKNNKRVAVKKFAIFSLITLAGAAPFAIRNLVLNHNPVFPIATELFNHFSVWPFNTYGRGTSPLDLLLLPYDLLYTTNFVHNFYDYTLGKLFFFQLGVVLLAVINIVLRKKWPSFSGIMERTAVSAAAFFIIYSLGWFYSSQQMRFLVPSLVLLNIAMLGLVKKHVPIYVVVALTLCSLLSVKSIQQPSWEIAFGNGHSFIQRAAAYTAFCFHRAGVTPQSTVAHLTRDSALGYFDHDFLFGERHPYIIPKFSSDYVDKVDFIFDPEKSLKQIPKNFVFWPQAHPCVYKRVK